MTEAVETPQAPPVPPKKKINWKFWGPLAFFAIATVLSGILYGVERSMRFQIQADLALAQNELKVAAEEIAQLDKLVEETETLRESEVAELTQRMNDLEADKVALEKERDLYKEGSWNSQQEVEKLKQEIAKLRV